MTSFFWFVFFAAFVLGGSGKSMSQAAAGKILRNLSPTAPVRDHKAVPDLMAERQSTWISQAQLNSIQRRREQFDGPLPRFQDWNINEYEAASSFPTVSANESALPSDSGEGFSSTDDEDDLPELVHLQKFCFLFFFWFERFKMRLVLQT